MNRRAARVSVAKQLLRQLAGNAALYGATLALRRLNRLAEIKHHLFHGRIARVESATFSTSFTVHANASEP